MITEVYLRNFKCWRSLSLKAAAITLLTGMNGMGKSSILQALLILRQSKQSGELDGGSLLLGGDLVDAGTGVDIFCEDALDETISIGFSHDSCSPIFYRYEYDRQADKLEQIPHDSPAEYAARKVLESGIDLFSDDFFYVQAERSGPRKMFPMSESRARRADFGVRGEYTLHSLKIREHQVLSPSDPRVLTDYGSRLTDQVDGWLQHVTPGTRLSVELVPSADIAIGRFSFERTGDVPTRAYRATNVGFGLSYVLPVIASLLTARPGGLVFIENPEAHLHPRGQTRLGELAARAAAANVQVFVETHSDHFMDGVRISVRENVLQPSSCAFHYFSRHGAVAEIVSPQVDADGRLSHWPEGFFDQHDENLSKLLAPRFES